MARKRYDDDDDSFDLQDGDDPFIGVGLRGKAVADPYAAIDLGGDDLFGGGATKKGKAKAGGKGGKSKRTGSAPATTAPDVSKSQGRGGSAPAASSGGKQADAFSRANDILARYSTPAAGPAKASSVPAPRRQEFEPKFDEEEMTDSSHMSSELLSPRPAAVATGSKGVATGKSQPAAAAAPSKQLQRTRSSNLSAAVSSDSSILSDSYEIPTRNEALGRTMTFGGSGLGTGVGVGVLSAASSARPKGGISAVRVAPPPSGIAIVDDDSMMEEEIPEDFVNDSSDGDFVPPVTRATATAVAAPAAAAARSSAAPVRYMGVEPSGKLSTAAGASGASAGKHRFSNGDSVQAQFAQGTAWFNGRVQRCNPDGTYEIVYDDGDVEKKVFEKHVRARAPAAAPAPAPATSSGTAALSSAYRTSAAPAAAVASVASVASVGTEDTYSADDDFDEQSTKVVHRFKVGDVVDAQYGRDVDWYPGRVAACNRDGTYEVLYDDGDREDGVLDKHIRTRVRVTPAPAPAPSLAATAAAASRPAAVAVSTAPMASKPSAAGLNANANANLNANANASVASVASVGTDDTYSADDDFDDHSTKVVHRFKVDDVVDAQYGREVDWYPGRVAACNSDGTYEVLYDDGDREDGVLDKHLRARERRVVNQASLAVSAPQTQAPAAVVASTATVRQSPLAAAPVTRAPTAAPTPAVIAAQPTRTVLTSPAAASVKAMDRTMNASSADDGYSGDDFEADSFATEASHRDAAARRRPPQGGSSDGARGVSVAATVPAPVAAPVPVQLTSAAVSQPRTAAEPSPHGLVASTRPAVPASTMPVAVATPFVASLAGVSASGVTSSPPAHQPSIQASAAGRVVSRGETVGPLLAVAAGRDAVRAVHKDMATSATQTDTVSPPHAAGVPQFAHSSVCPTCSCGIGGHGHYPHPGPAPSPYAPSPYAPYGYPPPPPLPMYGMPSPYATMGPQMGASFPPGMLFRLWTSAIADARNRMGADFSSPYLQPPTYVSAPQPATAEPPHAYRRFDAAGVYPGRPSDAAAGLRYAAAPPQPGTSATSAAYSTAERDRPPPRFPDMDADGPRGGRSPVPAFASDDPTFVQSVGGMRAGDSSPGNSWQQRGAAHVPAPRDGVAAQRDAQGRWSATVLAENSGSIGSCARAVAAAAMSYAGLAPQASDRVPLSSKPFENAASPTDHSGSALPADKHGGHPSALGRTFLPAGVAGGSASVENTVARQQLSHQLTLLRHRIRESQLEHAESIVLRRPDGGAASAH